MTSGPAEFGTSQPEVAEEDTHPGRMRSLGTRTMRWSNVSKKEPVHMEMTGMEEMLILMRGLGGDDVEELARRGGKQVGHRPG